MLTDVVFQVFIEQELKDCLKIKKWHHHQIIGKISEGLPAWLFQKILQDFDFLLTVWETKKGVKNTCQLLGRSLLNFCTTQPMSLYVCLLCQQYNWDYKVSFEEHKRKKLFMFHTTFQLTALTMTCVGTTRTGTLLNSNEKLVMSYFTPTPSQMWKCGDNTRFQFRCRAFRKHVLFYISLKLCVYWILLIKSTYWERSGRFFKNRYPNMSAYLVPQNKCKNMSDDWRILI